MTTSIKKQQLRKGDKSHNLHDSLSYVDEAGAIPDGEHEKYLEFVIDLADKNREITKTFTSSKEWLDFVLKLRKKHKIHPRKAQIKKLYVDSLKDGTILEKNLNLEQYLTIKQSRSLSGVLVIAVLMSPYPLYLDSKTGKIKQQRFSCAHNCYYCPNEPGMPRSYLSKEAAVARAIRSRFDAIDQFYSRANTLKKLGHDVDKIELLVLGGTFCQFPVEYQEQFIRDLFWSANTFYDGIDDYKKKRPRKSLAEEIKIHETATKCRIVGLTLETRPDTIRDFQTIKRFREYGATRLQVGVQHTDDTILKYINRGCYNSDTITAVRLLKNSGYKIDIHLMPNLPGSSPEKDREMFDNMFTSDLIQCDQWKVYPCQTVDYSLIQKWYEKGIYKPYSLDKLLDIIIGLKSQIPPWIRLNRIFRSLPAEHITSGITMSNFRQHVIKKMNEKGLKCRDIRSREIGTHIRRQEITLKELQKSKESAESAQQLKIELERKLSKPGVLKKRKYKSSGGDEIFLSFESEDEEILMGFVRLRLPPIYIKPEDRSSFGLNSDQAFLNDFKCEKGKDGNYNYGTEQEYSELITTFPELYQAALVREAHVYGATQRATTSVSSNNNNANASSFAEANEIRRQQNLTGQSMGYGTKLMTAAEEIAKEKGYSRVAVIAGVGTRLYYRLKLGYKSAGTYMVKDFNESSVGRLARGDVNNLNASRIRSTASISIGVCLILYLISAFLSILLSLGLAITYILMLDYLHFFKIKHNVNATNASLLHISKCALIAINFSVFFKVMSTLFPHIHGVPFASQILALFDEWSALQGNSDCFCSAYWSLSLVLYVAAFYGLKLIYHKRVIIMIQDPLFGNDSGIRSIPVSLANLLLTQIASFTICQFLCLNCTRSYCTDESSFPYDVSSSHGCHDQFDPIVTGIAIIAILFDCALFSIFCSKWYSIMLLFMEEMATSLLIQFSLVCVGMTSCIFDALVHLSFIYMNRGANNNYANFDSFLGTPAFLLDNCIMATCIVLSFTETQKFVLNYTGIGSMKGYFQSLENIGYRLHIM